MKIREFKVLQTEEEVYATMERNRSLFFRSIKEKGTAAPYSILRYGDVRGDDDEDDFPSAENKWADLGKYEYIEVVERECGRLVKCETREEVLERLVMDGVIYKKKKTERGNESNIPEEAKLTKGFQVDMEKYAYGYIPPIEPMRVSVFSFAKSEPGGRTRAVIEISSNLTPDPLKCGSELKDLRRNLLPKVEALVKEVYLKQ